VVGEKMEIGAQGVFPVHYASRVILVETAWNARKNVQMSKESQLDFV